MHESAGVSKLARKEAINIRRLLVVLECTDIAMLNQCHTPNIDSLDPHPAISYGITTGAAAGAFSRGFLPICVYKDCYHHKIKWQSPFFLRELSRKTNLFLLTPNGWTFQTFEPFMTEEVKRLNYDWHSRHEDCVSLEMVEYLEKKRPSDYFALLWLQESHPPYFHPDWKGVSAGEINKSPRTPDPPTRRKMAIEWIDSAIISKILQLDYHELVITADHPLSHPGDEREFIQELESSRSPQKYQVFLATDIRS